MKPWDLKEFVSHFKIQAVVLNMGDNMDILYKDKLSPVKIDGKIRPELKVVKGSYCNYHDELDKKDIELLAIEEYSDALNSIYIDKDGVVDTYNYSIKKSIELGETIKLFVQNKRVKSYIFSAKKKSHPMLSPWGVYGMQGEK